MRALGPGDEIADFTVEAVAGRGGMGVVYRARQRRPQRTVALKVIAPELAADPGFRQRFDQESTIAAQIEHPNVIPVYGVGEEDGLLFIAMRFVAGSDLSAVLAAAGRLEPRRAAHILSQVASALDAAHAHGLVHRDVKPGNVLVAAEDHAYLTDFGLTKRLADSHGMTATGLVVGTLNYIAPEQIEGGQVDARADVYALGCVAFEVMSGRVPFRRDSDVAMLYAHVNEPAPRLEGVPEPMADAVVRAMAKRPADRFLSAGDFGRALTSGAEGRSVSGGERSVAIGRAALADTPVVDVSARETRVADPRRFAPTEVARGELGGEKGAATTRLAEQAPSGRGRSWLLAGGGALVVAAAAVAIVLALGGKGPTTTGSSSTPTVSSSTAAKTTSSSTAAANLKRPVLAPATTPPKVDVCQMQLVFGADGTAGPAKCANGDLNSVAWKYYAQPRAYGTLLGLGAFATPQQVINAMCSNHNSTVPQTLVAYQLASSYYGWKFGIDPSSEYPDACS